MVIARALINSPRFLLADEPTSDLDEDTEADIIELLDRIRKKESVGLIVVAHDLRIAHRPTAPSKCATESWRRPISRI